jgi:hypothetical protein
MKNIKKIAVLVTAMGAMAAFAVPSMASAAVWGPLNTNQTLTSSAASYDISSQGISWRCNNQLGVHVRTPASSTLDVTSSSWTLCQGTGSFACTVSMAATGLPWTAVATSSTSVNFTMHARVTFGGVCGSPTTSDVQGTVTGSWSAATHKLTFTNAPGFVMSYMGTTVGNVVFNSQLANASQTLTLT